MIRFFPNEQWHEIELEAKLKLRYAISNHGRFVSFTDKIESGTLLKCTKTKGFKVFRYNQLKEGKKVSSSKYIHKLVAEYFLPKPNKNQTFVIHIDNNPGNNSADNLRWADKEEVVIHQNKNPKIIAAREKSLNSYTRKNNKLNEQKVRIIKRKLLDPNRKTRLKMIARAFGISEMQLHRIKTGENWGHVSIETDKKEQNEDPSQNFIIHYKR
jgi:hypothetical protein